MDYLFPICIGAMLPWMCKVAYSKLSESNNQSEPVWPSMNDVIDTSVKSFNKVRSSAEALINQKLFSPQKIGDNTPKSSKYIGLFHSMQWYKVPLVMKRGPVDFEIILIHDGNDVDITSNILPFCGPSLDFFGISVSPHFFGYDKMTFHTNTGLYSFEGETVISFNDVSKIQESKTPPPSQCCSPPTDVDILTNDVSSTMTSSEEIRSTLETRTVISDTPQSNTESEESEVNSYENLLVDNLSPPKLVLTVENPDSSPRINVDNEHLSKSFVFSKCPDL